MIDISKEAQDHFIVGPGLGEIEGKSPRGGTVKYKPLVNVPTHPTGGATGEHFLESEITEAGHTEPVDTLPVGEEASSTSRAKPS